MGQRMGKCGDVSFTKNQGCVSGKQRTQKKTFSEEDVHDRHLPSSPSATLRPHNYNRRSKLRRHLHGSQPRPCTQRWKKPVSSARSRRSTTRIKRQLCVELSGFSYKQSVTSWSPACSSKGEVEVVEKENRSESERESEHGSSSTSSPLSPNKNVSRYPENSPSSILHENDCKSSSGSRKRPDRLNRPTQLEDEFDFFSSLSLICSSKTKDETVDLSASQCDTDRDDPVSSVPRSQQDLPADLNVLFEQLSVQSESVSAGDSDSLVKMEAPVTAVISSVTNTQPTRPHLQLSSDPGWSQRGSSCLPRSHSVPSLSQRSCAENQTFRPSQSLPDMLLKSSFEEFTPDITVDEDDESYRFLCSCPGLYQCSVTGLVFHMEGEGDVVYRIVSWDRRLLAQHHKKPAGPLFDIKCQQKSVCRLHLPHCEIPSTAGCQFLSVAHLNDEGIEFIAPHKVTETHVIINISGFSGYGNIKDKDSPPEPVRALVLLFYRPLNELISFLNVLMLPGNVSVRDVRRTRKSLVGDELYIETSSHCKLLPGQEYTLSTCPEDDSVLVQPKEAEFDKESYDNYIPSFQVRFRTVMLNMKALLRDTSSSHIVWEREVCLLSAGLQRLCVQGRSDRILFDIRSSFIEGISGPVLKSLLDKLFEKKVLIDSERESADEMQNRGDKARLVIDTVRRKGEAASSEMIEFLCELDPFLCKHLGLM
ncbi:uncharacterized protein LOC119009075 [Acanthopagrus latus]|uniref:uncharacterized protein LOC119009075 n=1 Tax=Acanthopagrus latus TaxID=8177 RepID=UPI00187C1368|nr:uncharacterized protein LOC119009075 [Acanthopagrus latus]XP_036935965.1 uncharacterized protein LOC119009075 [Acanthopagrus latus]XP_036935966.1 uncharacterized protein LOC119009075 [Acanthopagrus latus]XP_036935967.1 uncharacterized protein LOC119009075 [Acanthopagrus latus]XP_036935968.1 uncharacterized protein LOC119009075 [Acanthopagrus latus]